MERERKEKREEKRATVMDRRERWMNAGKDEGMCSELEDGEALGRD